ncbi:MAG: PrgI family protein [Candidatus Vogelbacteria bacterium]|nr:PrgI family protein [Candidatus Vogelbacteria bacterium]
MQFQVPQFIEVEDKIVGPFTFKQLIFMIGGLGGIYILKKILPAMLAYPLMLALGVFTWALIFYKYNDRPFILALQSWIKYELSAKLYLWNKHPKPITTKDPKKPGAAIPTTMAPTVSQNKLKELSWSLDIQDSVK